MLAADPHSLKYFVDIIEDFGEAYDWQEIKGYMMQQKLGSLRTPFCPKARIAAPFAMQIIIGDSEVDNGKPRKKGIIKCFAFEDNKSAALVKPMAQGNLMRIGWGVNKKGRPKGFQYMLDKLDGHQMRYYSFGTSVEAKLQDSHGIDLACDFITKEGPRHNGPKLLQNQ